MKRHPKASLTSLRSKHTLISRDHKRPWDGENVEGVLMHRKTRQTQEKDTMMTSEDKSITLFASAGAV